MRKRRTIGSAEAKAAKKNREDVDASVATMSHAELRTRLEELGDKPGPIDDSNRCKNRSPTPRAQIQFRIVQKSLQSHADEEIGYCRRVLPTRGEGGGGGDEGNASCDVKRKGWEKIERGRLAERKNGATEGKKFLVVHLKELASQSLIKRALSKINRLQPVFTLRFHFTLRRIRKWYLPLGSTGYHLHSFTYTIPDMRMLVHKTSVFADPNGLVVVSSATRAVHAMRF